MSDTEIDAEFEKEEQVQNQLEEEVEKEAEEREDNESEQKVAVCEENEKDQVVEEEIESVKKEEEEEEEEDKEEIIEEANSEEIDIKSEEEPTEIETEIQSEEPTEEIEEKEPVTETEEEVEDEKDSAVPIEVDTGTTPTPEEPIQIDEVPSDPVSNQTPETESIEVDKEPELENNEEPVAIECLDIEREKEKEIEDMEEIVGTEIEALTINQTQTENNNEKEAESHSPGAINKTPIIKKSGIRPPKTVIKMPMPSAPSTPVSTRAAPRPNTTPAPRVTPKQMPSPRPLSKMSRERSDVQKSTSTKSIDNVGKFTPKVNAKFVNVKSKVGSVTNHKAGGGNVEIFSQKREYVAQSKVGSLQNANHVAGGGKVKIESRNLDFSNAAPKVASKTNYTPAKSDVKIVSEKLQWNAESKVGSLDNATHKPAGGNVQILHQKLNWRAESKVGSKDNIRHRPGGGNVKVVSSEIAISRPTVIHVTAKPKMAATMMDKRALKRKSVSQRSSTASLSMFHQPKQFPGAIYPLSSDYVFRK